MLRSFLTAIVGIQISTLTCAASFDCSTASIPVERLVCDSDELSKLDDTLDKTYWLAMERKIDKPGLMSEQGWWLQGVRNKCLNSECLKSVYVERIHHLQPPRFSKPYEQSSYFVDLRHKSIDEELNGCFADTSCAKQAEVLVPEYSKASNIPESETWSQLKNCQRYQSSMNTCAGYEQFVIRNELSEALRKAIEEFPPKCRTAIVKAEAEWEAGINKSCTGRTNSEVGVRGTAWGGVYLSCKNDSLTGRIRELKIPANILNDYKPIAECVGAR